MTAINEKAPLLLMEPSLHTQIAYIIDQAPDSHQAVIEILKQLSIPADASIDYIPRLTRCLRQIIDQYLDLMRTTVRHMPDSEARLARIQQLDELNTKVALDYITKTS